eukprot:scaffold744_cov162-Amphora_coffeaeformis.AAC.3
MAFGYPTKARIEEFSDLRAEQKNTTRNKNCDQNKTSRRRTAKHNTAQISRGRQIDKPHKREAKTS